MKLKQILSAIGIALVGTLILICTNGMTFAGLTVFDESLIDEFGWTKGTLKFRDFINLCVAAVIVPFIGIFIDKYGVKRSFLFGLSLLAIFYFLYGSIQSHLHMYGIHVGFAFAVAAAGTLPVVIMVSQRVKSYRGLAIGLALAGTSAGGIIIPLIANELLPTYGWRQSFRYEALIPLLLIIVVLFFVKKSDTTDQGEKKTSDLVEISFKEALNMKAFWFLSIIGFFTYYAVMAAIGNLFLYMRELEFSTETSVKALGLLSLVIFFSKFISGALTEVFNKFNLFRIQVAIMVVGSLAFALHTTDSVWFAIPVFALGWGGLYTLINYIIITTFGVNAAGKIGGTISTFESIGAGCGIWLSGVVADYSGSYAMSFWITTAFLLIALTISFFIRPVVAPSHAS